MEMFKYLTQKNSQGKEIISMKDVILRNCPKLTTQIESFVHCPNINENIRSTNYRGVSKNGRCNW